jgi:hypothetical protein
MSVTDLCHEYCISRLTALRQRQAVFRPLGRSRTEARRRLAVQRNHDPAQRLRLHTSDRLEPVWQRRYPQPGPPFPQPRFHRSRHPGPTGTVVRSERIHAAHRRHRGRCQPGKLPRAGTRRGRPLAVQDHDADRSIERRVQGGVLQRTESGKLGHTQYDCFLQGSDQSVGRINLEHHDNIAAVPGGNEADLLTIG